MEKANEREQREKTKEWRGKRKETKGKNKGMKRVSMENSEGNKTTKYKK